MDEARRDRWLKRAILASQFAPAFMFSGVAVALPDMSRELQPSARELGLVETLFLAGSASFLLPMGRYSDASDARTLYRFGMYAFACLTLLLAFVPTTQMMLVLRFVQGAAAALITTTGPAILAQLVPPERRGRAFGAAIGITYAGLSAGPLCAGWLVEWGGWRAVYAAGAALLLLFALPVQRWMECRWRAPGRGSVHFASAALLACAVLLLVFGSAFWREGKAGAAAIAGAIVLGGAFAMWQLRLERPLLDLRALRGNRVLGAALAVQGLLYMNAYANIVLLSLHLQVVLAKGAPFAGQVLASGSALMAALAPFSGRLAERWQARRVAAAGVVVILVMALCATRLDAEHGPWFVALLLSLHGIGFALFSTPNMTIIMGAVPAGSLGTASALGAKARSLGMIGGMLVLAVLMASAFGSAPVQSAPAKLVAVEQSAYAALAVSGGLALALAWSARRRADA